MKSTGIVVGCVLLVLITIVAVAQEKELDRPVGVPADRWISLSEDAGVVLAEASPRHGAVEGNLMVRVKGQWVWAYPSQLPLKATPLDVR